MDYEPIIRCETCGRTLTVKETSAGFPPDIAKRSLVVLCKKDGHTATPIYRAGFSFPDREPSY